MTADDKAFQMPGDMFVSASYFTVSIITTTTTTITPVGV